MSDSTIKDIAIIGGVAALGIGAYSLLKGKNNVVVQGSENWEGVNKAIDQLSQSNSAFLSSILQILGQQDKLPAPDGGSSGGSSGGSDGGSSGGSGGDDEPTIDETKQLLETTNTALDKLGYSGLLKQSQTLMKEQADADAVKIASNPVLNVLDNALTTGNQTLLGQTININPVSALAPSNIAQAVSGVKGFGEWVYNLAKGKKNVDEPLAVL